MEKIMAVPPGAGKTFARPIPKKMFFSISLTHLPGERDLIVRGDDSPYRVRAWATETDVTVAAALARGGWLAKCYVPTYQKGNEHP